MEGEIYMAEHWTSKVKNVWEQISKRQFSSMLNQARKDALKKAEDKKNILKAKGHEPIWIAPDVWNRLIDIWNSPKWKGKLEAARKNRMTEKDGGITKYTSGSISFSTQKKNDYGIG
ncbi:hypothetical protein COCNU_05G006060 [Cocos nucifera]|uniref:Transposase n=1 Tax=Cocos nucifera TaxID=13894 RepID=A0A8K0I8D2_COCNU|nr:hypothetical protein COCNU_05G006060 [Cocos nucifera]